MAHVHVPLSFMITVLMGLCMAGILGFMASKGQVTARFLFRGSLVAVWLSFVVAAILTPTTDIMNMTIYAAPLVLMYVVSIGIARFVEPEQRRKRRERREKVQYGSRCLQCGCDYSAAVARCPGCGGALTPVPGSATAPGLAPFEPTRVQPPVEATEKEEPALGYATMGERFLAFLCDASVGWALLLLMVSYWKSPVDSAALSAMAVTVILVPYMTLAEVLFHRTIGKGLLRIQLRADLPGLPYPSPLRIFWRESVGKMLSTSMFGIGFLAGTWNRETKTWADRMANTVVVRTDVTSARFKAVLSIILICAYVGLSFAVPRR